MNQTIQSFPLFTERDKQGVDFCIAADIAGKDQLAFKFISKFGDAINKAFILEGEGQAGAFTMAGLGDAVSNRMFGQQTGDQNALAS